MDSQPAHFGGPFPTFHQALFLGMFEAKACKKSGSLGVFPQISNPRTNQISMDLKVL